MCVLTSHAWCNRRHLFLTTWSAPSFFLIYSFLLLSACEIPTMNYKTANSKTSSSCMTSAPLSLSQPCLRVVEQNSYWWTNNLLYSLTFVRNTMSYVCLSTFKQWADFWLLLQLNRCSYQCLWGSLRWWLLCCFSSIQVAWSASEWHPFQNIQSVDTGIHWTAVFD